MSESFDAMAASLSAAVKPFKEEKSRKEEAEAAKLKAEREARESDMALMPDLEKSLSRVRSKISENFKKEGLFSKGLEVCEVNGEKYFFRSMGSTERVFTVEMGVTKGGVDPENIGPVLYPDTKGDVVRISFDPVSGAINAISFTDSDRVMSSIVYEGNLARAVADVTVEYGTHDMEDFRNGLKTFDVRHEFTKGRFNVMKARIEPFLKAFEAKNKT